MPTACSQGGNFDRLAGIAAFAAVAAWRALGLRPKRDFTITAFRAEEPGLLGIGKRSSGG